jgi:hypothetical protein
VGDLLKTSTGAEGKWFRFLFAGVGGGSAGSWLKGGRIEAGLGKNRTLCNLRVQPPTLP